MERDKQIDPKEDDISDWTSVRWILLRFAIYAICFSLIAWGQCGCVADDVLTRCDVACYHGNSKTAGIGECRAGVTVCTSSITTCVGEVVPINEICDGKDNDCDGVVDERLRTIACGIAQGECHPGYTACINGVDQCVNAKWPAAEICDGLDNDCDGVVDNDAIEEVLWCYPGLPETSINQPCRPGYEICVDGASACYGAILPSLVDICGDGIDNDCNGIIDDVTTSTVSTNVDIVFIVDRSGSMGGIIASVQSALLSFLQMRDATYRYWLIDLPGALDGTYTPNVFCHTSSVAPVAAAGTNDFATALRSLAANHGGTELSYDALNWICADGTIAWRPDSRRFIVFFGDEAGQTRLKISETDVAIACREIGASFYGFISGTYIAHYDDIANLTGGNLYDVQDSSAGLRVTFETELIPTCRR